VENPEILDDSRLYLRRPPDDLPEEEWAENYYTVNTRRPISALGMVGVGVGAPFSVHTCGNKCESSWTPADYNWSSVENP